MSFGPVTDAWHAYRFNTRQMHDTCTIPWVTDSCHASRFIALSLRAPHPSPLRGLLVLGRRPTPGSASLHPGLGTPAPSGPFDTYMGDTDMGHNDVGNAAARATVGINLITRTLLRVRAHRHK